jgi:hypothetical protein
MKIAFYGYHCPKQQTWLKKSEQGWKFLYLTRVLASLGSILATTTSTGEADKENEIKIAKKTIKD